MGVASGSRARSLQVPHEGTRFIQTCPALWKKVVPVAYATGCPASQDCQGYSLRMLGARPTTAAELVVRKWGSISRLEIEL